MRNIAVFFFLLLPIINIIASDNPVFRQINAAEELSHNYINEFLEDSYGYLWIATSHGLNRYDGYTMEIFYHDPDNEASLHANSIQALTEDYKKNIWIVNENWLSCYDYKSGTIKRYDIRKNNSEENGLDNYFYIYSIFAYKDLLYVGTNDGVYVLNTETERLSKIHINHHKINNVRSILRDNQGFIWFSSNDMVYKYNPRSGDISYYSTPQSVHYQQDEPFVKIRTDKYNNIWAGAPSGVYKYNRIKDKMELEYPLDGNIDLQVNDSLLWIATWDRGLLKYNINDKTTSNYTYTGKKPNEINSNTLSAIYIDRNKNLWIGTGGKGINIYSRYTNFFKTFRHEYNDPSSLSSSQIRAVYCDSQERYWIGSSLGLNRFYPENETFVTYLSKDNYHNESALNNFVLSICEDNNGKLWVGTLAGLNLFDSGNGNLKIFSHLQEHELLSSNQIWCIEKDKDGMLWVGTRMGLYFFNPLTYEIKPYIFNPENKVASPSPNNVTAVYPGIDAVWVGTKEGLFRLNPDGKRDVFTIHSHPHSPLNSNQINDIYVDSKKRMWICTNGGINKYISDKDGFENFTSERIKNIQFLSIREDSSGIFWITSTKGLIRFDADAKTFNIFGTYDGLIGNEFCPGALFRNKQDLFFAGSVEGLNIFSPKDIHAISQKPNLHFTKFALFDEVQTPSSPSSPLKKDINMTDKIELNHNRNFFSITYTSIDLLNARIQQYAYMLEGFDLDWTNAGSRRTAFYTKVPPGKYTFKVKLLNSDYQGNENIRSIDIIIRKPFYATWWAYGIYFLAFILLMYLFRKYTLINVREKNDLLLSKIEKEKEEALYNMKVKFFMNISHEFRTPLTLIDGPVQKLLKEEGDKNRQKLLLLIRKNSQKLLSLIDQLLEFRKTETGTRQPSVSENDIILHTSEIISVFEELAERQTIQLQFKTNLKMLPVWFDSDMYEKILFNLLSNAFKFTSSGGRITVYLTQEPYTRVITHKYLRFFSKKEKVTEMYASIRVEDTGKGIAPDKLSKVFDRFYQTDTKDGISGTGIGLSLVKNLVEIHHGFILADSTPGIGTEFKVLLPLGNKHFTAENINTSINPEEYKVTTLPLEMGNLFSNISPEVIESENIVGFLPEDEEEKPVLLIVEDNPDIIMYVKNCLETQYRIISAENGKTGIEKALRFIPDIILCDINMPVMDGIEMTRLIRNNEFTSHIPVILITALSSVEYEIDGLSRGADDYISKPFNIQVLELKIRNLLAARNELRKKVGQEMIFEQVGPKNIDSDDKFLERFNAFLVENLSNPELDVDFIVDEMAMSRSQLYRKIKSISDMSVKIYVRTFRLMYAKNLLHNKDVRISEVMDSVGISSRSYFIKSFKSLYGMTPSEYQEKIFHNQSE